MAMIITEHYPPPAAPSEALAAVIRLDDHRLSHIRGCRLCRVAWYHSGAFRAGCTDPRIGAQVLSVLSAHKLLPAVYVHIEHCLACRVFLMRTRSAGGPSTSSH